MNVHRGFRAFLGALALCAGCALPSTDGPVGEVDGSLESAQVQDFGTNPGKLSMYIYVPEGLPKQAPLVVALHGCAITAKDYAHAGWSGLADISKFAVLYPERPGPGDGACFAWFDPEHNRRGHGQAASIVQMVDWMKAHHDIDPRRVFVTGLSAGGAMTSVLMATYPEVFSAGAVMAGVPYRCATSQVDGVTCMTGQKDLSPSEWGDLVRQAAPESPFGPRRMSLWQGASDFVVRPNIQNELLEQWTDVNHIDAVADDETLVADKGIRRNYRDATGVTLVQTWLVKGMGHGTAIQSGFAPAGGCGAPGVFFDDVGICSTWEAAGFFGLVEPAVPEPKPEPGKGGPGTAPGVGGTTGFVCRDIEDNNVKHKQEGRADFCSRRRSHVCAKGSTDDLGLWSIFQRTALRQVGEGYFEHGTCAERPAPSN